MSANQIPSWEMTKARISVPVNGILVPMASTPKACDRFVRPAMFSTNEELWELQYRGSATLLRYRGRSFVVTTAHQTGDGIDAPKPEKFVVISHKNNARFSVPPTALYSVKDESSDQGVEYDIKIYEYTGENGGEDIQFLDVSEVIWSDFESNFSTDYSFLIGFPTERVQIELDDETGNEISEYTLRWIRQDLERSGRQPVEPEDRIYFRKHAESKQESVDPDGLSGCPVFSIVHGRDKKRDLCFDGIVTNASRDRFAVMPSSLLREALESIVNG